MEIPSRLVPNMTHFSLPARYTRTAMSTFNSRMAPYYRYALRCVADITHQDTSCTHIALSTHTKRYATTHLISCDAFASRAVVQKRNANFSRSPGKAKHNVQCWVAFACAAHLFEVDTVDCIHWARAYTSSLLGGRIVRLLLPMPREDDRILSGCQCKWWRRPVLFHSSGLSGAGVKFWAKWGSVHGIVPRMLHLILIGMRVCELHVQEMTLQQQQQQQTTALSNTMAVQ